MTEGPELRIGVMSTANISRKNVDAMKAAKGVRPVSIGSRDAARAKDFAAEHCLETAYGSYEELLGDPTVDAVYIPLPTVLHAEWVARTVIAGKHLLLEKPVARNARELNAMLEECEEANLAFMDGIMFAHHDRLARMREQIAAEALGAAGVRAVHSVFCFRGDKTFFADNIRVRVDGDPLGCLGDLGWYNVRLSLWAFHDELPVEVRGVIHTQTEAGVPTSFSGTLLWADDVHTAHPAAHLGVGAARAATFFCSFTHCLQQRATLSGDSAYIEIPDFVVPIDPDEASFTVVTPQKDKSEARTVHTVKGCRQEVRMWEAFAALVRDGGGDRRAWMRAALANQLVVDALLESARRDGAPVRPDPDHLMARYTS